MVLYFMCVHVCASLSLSLSLFVCTCAVVPCSSLPTTLINGAVTGTVYTYGSSVTFTCSSTYYITGEAQTITERTLQCQASGQWNGSTPTCTSTWDSILKTLDLFPLNINPSVNEDKESGLKSFSSCLFSSLVMVICDNEVSLYRPPPPISFSFLFRCPSLNIRLKQTKTQ